MKKCIGPRFELRGISESTGENMVGELQLQSLVLLRKVQHLRCPDLGIFY